ncbi:histone deacetylation protein Rxt3-domain-containing protein [Phascolomyces articulosus]|uniref:Histone deacetylation protein Rxt3-domain-containing protein n=1 Tax=Phascolomyces articulosus TaxID=60185 RepID=A0AAD5PA18_9FUNG|nr:histone deacetylation protein Rxt3-domain-containing protein [Phascolomyces articulosus]
MTDRATTATATSPIVDSKNGSHGDVRNMTSPDLVHKTNTMKNTSSSTIHGGHGGSLVTSDEIGSGSTRSSIPAFSRAKTLYSVPYDTPGMRMSVSAVLAGSGRDSTYYRGSTTSPKITSSTIHQHHPISPPPTLPPPRPSHYDPTTTTRNMDNNTKEHDKSLTNEQLVRALTSVPPAASSSTNDKNKSTSIKNDTKAIGNALAAVAATVAQRTTSTPTSPSTSSSSAAPTPSNITNGPTSTATAVGAAIGNLAAILQANGVGSPQQQQNHSHLPHHHQQQAATQQSSPGSMTEKRRPSALQLTQMIDQAIRFGVRNQVHPQESNTVTVQGHTYDSSPYKLKGKSKEEEKIAQDQEKKKPPQSPPQKVVRNDKVWEKLQGLPERRLGSYIYSPGMLLPINESQLNGLIQVVIPARYLTFENPQMKRKALWGTDIYTDDSDIVPMIVHSGKYDMPFVEPDIDPRDPFFLALGASDMIFQEDPYNKKKKPSTTMNGGSNHHTIPDHDVKVTLRVVPTLKRYTGTIRHCISSRTWNGNHDGSSYWVENVEKIQRGDAQPIGRHGMKANMNKYAYERYLTVGPPAPVKRRWQQLDQEEQALSLSSLTPFKRLKSKTKKKVKVVSPPPVSTPPPSTPSEQPASPATSSRRRVRRAAAKNKR